MSSKARTKDVVQELQTVGPARSEAGPDEMTRVVDQIVAGGATELPHRQELEAFFGVPLDGVGVYYADPALFAELGSVAINVGSNIGLPTGGVPQEVLVHEVTHAIQGGAVEGKASGGPLTGMSSGGEATEQEADAMARRFQQTPSSELQGRMPGEGEIRAGGEALGVAEVQQTADSGRIHRCGCTPSRAVVVDPVDEAYRGTTPWTGALATQALAQFAAAAPAGRQAIVDRYASFQTFGPMLQQLPAGSTQPGGANEVVVRDLLQRVQRQGALADAASQGLPNQGAMAQAQADEMTRRNTAAAAARRPIGPPPTAAEIAAQQQGQVESTSIAPQTAVMTPARETALNTELNGTLIPRFVTWCTGAHRELGITAAHFRADARAVFERGAGIIAFADGGGRACVVGESFADAVRRNPAYALPTVVHELWGHDTYGSYGDPGAELGLELYDQAAARMPGYTRPAAGTDARTSEIDAYAYQETEMYSLMREVPFFTPNAPADQAAMSSVNYDPGPAIGGRISTIKDQWEPRVARSLLRGLYLRFMADPTVGAAAMTAFRNGVRAAGFPAADVTAILR